MRASEIFSRRYPDINYSAASEAEALHDLLAPPLLLARSRTCDARALSQHRLSTDLPARSRDTAKDRTYVYCRSICDQLSGADESLQRQKLPVEASAEEEESTLKQQNQ